MRGSGEGEQQPGQDSGAVRAGAAARDEAATERDAVSFVVRFLAAQARLGLQIPLRCPRSRAGACCASARSCGAEAET